MIMEQSEVRRVVVFCAHPDDEVIGPGGTLLKYAKEGIETHVVIFSGGEMSNSLYDKEKLVSIREKESLRAAKILRITNLVNLGLRDSRLSADAALDSTREKVKSIIEELQPEKIFTHSIDDMLYPDHRAVFDCVKFCVDDLNSSIENVDDRYSLYTFNVWTVNIRGRDLPKLVIPINEEFSLKVKALKAFKSQKLALVQLTPVVYVRAILAGWKNDTKFVEEFYKVV